MKVLQWIDKNLEEFIISVILVIISCLMLAQFVLRFFGYSLTWSDEACRYLFVWSVGVGISYASKKGEHLRMDIIVNIFPKTEKFFEIICDISLVLVSLWLLKPGYNVLVQLMNSGQWGASTNVPMWVVYASMLFGLSLTIIRLFQKYLKMIIKKAQKAGDTK